MKRLIALFLSLTMLLSLCPVNIWAEELTAKDQQVYIAEDTSADDLSGDDSAVESESQTEDEQNSTDDEVVVEDSSASAPSEEEETPSEGEDETAENGEAAFGFESITVSTPVANAAATVEARWGLATGANYDQVPAENAWVGSGTLVQAMTYANGRSSGEVAYIQLQSDVSNGSRIMVNTGKAMVLDLNGNDINRGLKSASSTGEVIRVQGNLTICDTSPTASSAPGKITGGYCTTDGGGITVVGGTLTLKNGEISGNKTSASVGGVYVISSTTTSGTTYGAFTMKGGSISNNAESGVLVGAKSTFTMDDGTISGNNGIGVTVTAVGTKFILNNGTISGNKNGGVRLVGGTFTMNDGKITGNTSLTDGGGVYVATGNGGTFTMNAGTISGNTAARWGGGVYYNSEYGFIMNGGEISGNTADTAGGGIHYVGTGFSVSGKAKIIDNKVGTADNNVNQYYNSRRISVGTLSPGAKIGVTLADGTGTFSTGGAAYANSDYFFSDNDAYAVYDDGENLKLAAVPATVTVTFNANGGSGTMSSMTVHYNTATILKDNTFTRAGYAFTGWNTAADGSGTAYADKALITTKKAVTLYAQWKDTHSHPTCGIVGCTTTTHEHSSVATWTKLNSVGTSLGSGNYYLGQDITVNSTISISGTVNLCLNGNTLSLASGKIGSVISVPAGATLNLCDCSNPSTGVITGGNANNEGGGIYVFGKLVMYGGTISGNNAAYRGGGVCIQEGTFILSGGNISDNTAKEGGGVHVEKGSFSMNGGAISGNNAIFLGGGVSTFDTFTLTSGTISGNEIDMGFGGGVYIAPDATLTMSGGTISKNTVTSGASGGGAGVFVEGTFNLSDGSISGNTAHYTGGGGVGIAGGSFAMSGGTISGNFVKQNDGGGLYINGGSANINGGKIEGNSVETSYNGGGIYLYSGILKVSGSPIIYENFEDGTLNSSTGLYENGKADNVYLHCENDKSAVITVDTLSPGTSIGVTMASSGRTFTSGGASYANSNYLTSDEDIYEVVDDGGGNLMLAKMATVTFHANGGGGNMEPQTVVSGMDVTLNANAFTRQGYVFNGWNTKSDGTGTTVPDKATFLLQSDVAFYAQWKHSHLSCGVANCTADHGHSTVDTWTELTKDDLDNGKLILTDGNSYYLGEDITVTNGAIINGTVNLCLNGKTLKNESGKAVDLNYSASVVVCDCSGNNAGTISGGSVGIWANKSNTKVTLYGGLVSGGTGISLSSSASYSTLTVYGGVVTATKHWGIEQVGIHSTVTVNGGSISGTHGIYSPNMYDGDGMSSYNKIHVTGGAITGTNGAAIFTECDTYVSGGTLNGNTYGLSISDDLHTIYLSGAPAISGTTGGIELDDAKITLTGALTNTTPIGVTMTTPGEFTSGWTTYMSDKSPTDYFSNDDGAYEVVLSGNELKLLFVHAVHPNCGIIDCANTTHGHSEISTWIKLTEADLNSRGTLFLESGKSYYLGEDITVSSAVSLGGKGVVLCLNGKLLKNELGSAIEIPTLSELVVCDCSGSNAGTIRGDREYGINVGYYGELTVNNGTISGVSAGILVGKIGTNTDYLEGTLTINGGIIVGEQRGIFVQGGDSEVSINGGTVKGLANSGIFAYEETAPATITVNGGTITGIAGDLGAFGTSEAYGIDVGNNNLLLSGSPSISGTTGDIRLNGSTITVADTLTNTTPIGITMTNPGTFAKPDGTNVTTLSSYAEKFTSDNADCTVVVDGTDLKLVQNEARWGLAVDGKAPTTWVGGGTFIDAVTYANTLQSGTAYIQLLSNVNTTYGISFVSGKTTILDLNGHTIDRGLTTGSNANSEVMGGYVLNAVGNLTLCDSSSSDVSKQGKITGGKNASSYGVENRTNCGGGVYVSSSGTFTLAGGNIEGNVAKQGGGVFSLGSFTMTGGAISGNSATYRGGGVCVQEGAFTMSGGTISDNTTKEGAGVDITNGSFTLSGGFISDNTASLYGGGVQGGPFIMTGGTISGNKADQGGGGVDVTASNTFTMEGGTISDNSASWGAGVNLPANGTFIMSGGTITGNTANDHAGVNAAGSFELSGSPIIIGNTIGTGNEAIASNVYQNGDRIVVGILTAGAAIGVSRSSGIGTFTTGGGNYTAYFTSDNADYIVANDGKGNLMLVYPTLTGVVAEGFSGSYDGKAHGITVTAPDGATVKYGTTEGTYDKIESPTITNAGELIVYYQVTKEGYIPATGSAKVDITKATASCTAPVAVEDLIYSGTPQALITPAATDCGTVQYMGENGAFSSSLPTRTNAGTYYVYYKVIGDANHNDTGVLGPVEVKMDKAPLTIIAKDHTITYSDAPANDGVSYSGFVNGETASALGGTLSYSYSYEQYGNVGEYTITPAGLSSNNYEISYTKGTLTVEQKEIGIKWDNTDLTYNGKEQKPTATATGIVNGDALTLTIDGAQSSASTTGYTATVKGISGDKAGNYKLPDNVVTTFTIAKATPSLCNVSVVGTVKDTIDPTDVVLTGTNTMVDGTFALTDEKLLANVSTYHWTFTPTDTANYNVVTGEVEIDVLDTVAPSAVVTVEENQWRTTLNTITFGLFFKETKTVTIEYADNENGSGIDAMLYYVSDKAVANVANIPWKTYSKSFNIDPDGTFVIYAKAVDKDGNSAMVNSDGIVLDASAPLLKDIVDGGIYYGDLTITASDALAGVNTVTVDGDTVVLENGQYTIAADNSEHTVVVADKAGNTQQYTVHVMKMYTVSFIVDGEILDTVTVGHGQSIGLPMIPDKAGYDQFPPYWNHNGKNITKDTEITAIYIINKYTVSGTVTSYLEADETVTIGLYVDDSTVAKYATVVTGNTVAYAIANVDFGIYTMKVSKENHVTREYTVVVDDHVTWNAEICPKGDVNLDGEVNADDLTALARHVAKIESLTDPYALLTANVDNNDMLSADDLTLLARFVAKIIPSL